MGTWKRPQDRRRRWRTPFTIAISGFLPIVSTGERLKDCNEICPVLNLPELDLAALGLDKGPGSHRSSVSGGPGQSILPTHIAGLLTASSERPQGYLSRPQEGRQARVAVSPWPLISPPRVWTLAQQTQSQAPYLWHLCGQSATWIHPTPLPQSSTALL